MAGATRDRGGLLELMRLVAGDALGVAGREQRGRRNQGRLARMALGARSNRLAGLPVLVLVARGTNSNRRFAERRVRGRNLSMATGALSWFGARIFVRAVTAHATTRGVHHDGRSIPLLHCMATHAILCSKVSVADPAIGRAESGSVYLLRGVFNPAVQWRSRPRRRTGFSRRARRCAGKGVAARAVGFDVIAEAMLSLGPRVNDGALLLMASGTTRGGRSSDRTAVQIVALRARHVLTHHVNLVPV